MLVHATCATPHVHFSKVVSLRGAPFKVGSITTHPLSISCMTCIRGYSLGYAAKHISNSYDTTTPPASLSFGSVSLLPRITGTKAQANIGQNSLSSSIKRSAVHKMSVIHQSAQSGKSSTVCWDVPFIMLYKTQVERPEQYRYLSIDALRAHKLVVHVQEIMTATVTVSEFQPNFMSAWLGRRDCLFSPPTWVSASQLLHDSKVCPLRFCLLHPFLSPLRVCTSLHSIPLPLSQLQLHTAPLVPCT